MGTAAVDEVDTPKSGPYFGAVLDSLDDMADLKLAQHLAGIAEAAAGRKRLEEEAQAAAAAVASFHLRLSLAKASEEHFRQ